MSSWLRYRVQTKTKYGSVASQNGMTQLRCASAREASLQSSNKNKIWLRSSAWSEHWTFNPGVEGSNPFGAIKYSRGFSPKGFLKDGTLKGTNPFICHLLSIPNNKILEPQSL